MSQEVEIEYKNMLTEKEYNTLLSFYGGSHPLTWIQTNHYADTPDFKLKNAGSALRIRELPDRSECTLKTPFNHHLLETTMLLNKEEAEQMLHSHSLILSEELNKKLSTIGISVQELRFFTSLTTERFEIKKGSCLIVLDKNTFGSKTDYELEIEADSEEEGWTFFQELLAAHHVPRREAQNKVKRAMDEANLHTDK